MEEKRKKEKRKDFAAKKNELKILEKKLVSQKRSNGSDWYRGKKNSYQERIWRHEEGYVRR